MRARGRPQNAAHAQRAAEDETLATAANALISWGFKAQGRGGVFDAVAEAAASAEIFGDRGPLSGRRVKEIWEEWQLTRPWQFRPQRYSRESLARRRPAGTLDELAARLLRFSEAPLDGYVGALEPELTGRALAELARFPNTRGGREQIETELRLRHRPRGRPRKSPG